MAEWLTKVLNKGEDPPPEARFARDSAWNWMAALDWEVRSTHGHTVKEQLASCERHFANETLLPAVRKSNGNPSPALVARVIEPLYGAAVFSTALVDLANDVAQSKSAIGPWLGPNLIVGWYYASYNALRSMLTASTGVRPRDTHAGSGDALQGQLRARLPHPFDMVAEWQSGEKFTPKLPALPNVAYQPGMHLIREFSNSRPDAQQMLLSYLGGTAKYYVWKIKRGLLDSPEFKTQGLTNFLRGEAKRQRDAIVRKKAYNFLHLAYRYRGKANYRDFGYLAYGTSTRADLRPFLLRLANTARFLHIAALVYVGRRLGQSVADEYSNDMAKNYRGYKLLVQNLPRP